MKKVAMKKWPRLMLLLISLKKSLIVKLMTLIIRQHRQQNLINKNLHIVSIQEKKERKFGKT